MLWNTQSCLLLGRELILVNLVSDVYGSSTHVEQEKGCPYPALATPQQRECLLVESWESLSLGRYLKPCGKKNFDCWCFRVTTHFGWGSGLLRERAKHGARPTFTTEFQIFAKLQVFKRHFCYQRVNGRCWAQVVGGCSSSLAAVAAPRKVSSEWWYLNEIKEAYRMWAIL